jgi:hypothetical protein
VIRKYFVSSKNLPNSVIAGRTKPRMACGILPHEEMVVFGNRMGAASRVLIDVLRFLSLGFRSRSQLAAENLFLRKQLALYAEHLLRLKVVHDCAAALLWISYE